MSGKREPAFTVFGVAMESPSLGLPGGGGGGGSAVKVAVTERASLIATSQLPVPEHSVPDQPVNVDPAVAVAARETLVPRLKDASQAEPQSIPAGEEVTVPLPRPPSPTDSP